MNNETVFYFDGDGIKSAAGWYYKGPVNSKVGPFHTEHSAQEAWIDLEMQKEEESR